MNLPIHTLLANVALPIGKNPRLQKKKYALQGTQEQATSIDQKNAQTTLLFFCFQYSGCPAKLNSFCGGIA